MYPTRPSDRVGVIIEDKKSKLLYREIRQALREGKILLLRKKKKFVDESSAKYYLFE